MNLLTEKLADGTEIEYTEFPPLEAALVDLFRELFLDHWHEIVFGPCLDGAVFEISLSRAPKSVQVKDGYLTVDTGAWHFHLCVGEPKVASDELKRRRRVARAAFFESKNATCVPRSYGLRLWNGAGEQMISVFFPNPYLTPEQKTQAPDWSRLELWKSFKAKYGDNPSPCRTSSGPPV